MTLQPWKKVSQETLAKNPWSTYEHAVFDLPSGYKADYYFLKIPNSVVIIGIDQDGSMPMVKQYRCLHDEFTVEFPNGGIDQGQTLEQAVKDEFAQEAQLKAEVYEKIGSFHTNNGRLQETCHVFIAYRLSPAFARKDPTEEFEQLSCTPQTFEEMIRTGEITDGMMLASWQIAKSRVMEIIKDKLNR
ncbi:MAG: NUDIX hydrolase [Patescibacteria group bacterium]